MSFVVLALPPVILWYCSYSNPTQYVCFQKIMIILKAYALRRKRLWGLLNAKSHFTLLYSHVIFFLNSGHFGWLSWATHFMSKLGITQIVVSCWTSTHFIVLYRFTVDSTAVPLKCLTPCYHFKITRHMTEDPVSSLH